MLPANVNKHLSCCAVPNYLDSAMASGLWLSVKLEIRFRMEEWCRCRARALEDAPVARALASGIAKCYRMGRLFERNCCGIQAACRDILKLL